MGWILKVSEVFCAAHFLRGYEGACERLHGHNWKVEVAVSGSRLDERGLLVDFRELKRALRDVLKKLDHTLLNDIPPFDSVNPSSENIAKFIFDELKKRIPSHAKVLSVTVWESPNASATYQE